MFRLPQTAGAIRGHKDWGSQYIQVSNMPRTTDGKARCPVTLIKTDLITSSYCTVSSTPNNILNKCAHYYGYLLKYGVFLFLSMAEQSPNSTINCISDSFAFSGYFRQSHDVCFILKTMRKLSGINIHQRTYIVRLVLSCDHFYSASRLPFSKNSYPSRFILEKKCYPLRFFAPEKIDLIRFVIQNFKFYRKFVLFFFNIEGSFSRKVIIVSKILEHSRDFSIAGYSR